MSIAGVKRSNDENLNFPSEQKVKVARHFEIIGQLADCGFKKDKEYDWGVVNILIKEIALFSSSPKTAEIRKMLDEKVKARCKKHFIDSLMSDSRSKDIDILLTAGCIDLTKVLKSCCRLQSLSELKYFFYRVSIKDIDLPVLFNYSSRVSTPSIVKFIHERFLIRPFQIACKSGNLAIFNYVMDEGLDFLQRPEISQSCFEKFCYERQTNLSLIADEQEIMRRLLPYVKRYQMPDDFFKDLKNGQLLLCFILLGYDPRRFPIYSYEDPVRMSAIDGLGLKYGIQNLASRVQGVEFEEIEEKTGMALFPYLYALGYPEADIKKHFTDSEYDEQLSAFKKKCAQLFIMWEIP